MGAPKQGRPVIQTARFRAGLLERQLQPELNNPRLSRKALGRGACPESAAETGVRVGEIRLVEDIEKFPAELQGDAFGDREALEDTHIVAVDMGARQSALAQ